MSYIIAEKNGDALDVLKDDEGNDIIFDDQQFALAFLEFEIGSDTDYEVFVV